jgi:uncharacterized protein (DUF2267 family)
LGLVDYDAFIDLTKHATGADREAAERATRAVLETLGERLGADEARQLVSHLPPELGPWLFTEGGAQAFDLQDFLRRVAEREHVDPATAEHHATVVFVALGRALDEHAYQRMVARLPKNFAPILPRGRYAGAVPIDELLLKAADRGHASVAVAERGVEAVLETLAQRIGGQADDLMAFLPARLHDALKRGRARPDPDLAVEEFLVRIAERADVSPARALELARAVLATLRDTVPSDEYFDLAVQLPPTYWNVLAQPA